MLEEMTAEERDELALPQAFGAWSARGAEEGAAGTYGRKPLEVLPRKC